MIVPAGISVGAGPVSGPATYAPRPGSQIRSVHASGSTRPRLVAAVRGDLRPQAREGVPQSGGSRPLGVPGRQVAHGRAGRGARLGSHPPSLPRGWPFRSIRPRRRPWCDGPMNAPDFDAAATFIAGHARVVDRRRFGRLFGEGPAGPVRDAVAAYRNDDGGFGHGLEPDCRAPGSQPPAVEMALRIMDEADAWDDALVRGACDWLASVAPAEGGAAFVEAGPQALADWPHAPWWVPEEGHPASLVPTGLIAGTLHRRGASHPWLDRATEVMWTRIGALARAGRLRHVRRAQVPPVCARPRPGPEAFGRVGPLILERNLVALDPEAPGEVHGPLDFAPEPDSLAREPVRRRDDQGAPGPPGARPARGRRVDVQLAGLVARRRTGLARLPDRRRPPHPARQRPLVAGTWPRQCDECGSTR